MVGDVEKGKEREVPGLGTIADNVGLDLDGPGFPASALQSAAKRSTGSIGEDLLVKIQELLPELWVDISGKSLQGRLDPLGFTDKTMQGFPPRKL